MLTTRKLLILGPATTAKKAPLPNPLYVYCTKCFSTAIESDAVTKRVSHNLPFSEKLLRLSIELKPLSPKSGFCRSELVKVSPLCYLPSASTGNVHSIQSSWCCDESVIGFSMDGLPPERGRYRRKCSRWKLVSAVALNKDSRRSCFASAAIWRCSSISHADRNQFLGSLPKLLVHEPGCQAAHQCE